MINVSQAVEMAVWIIVTMIACLVIYRHNLNVTKQRCKSWYGTKAFLFNSQGNRTPYEKIPRWQVTQDQVREELMASEDYKIIRQQAKRGLSQMAVAVLAISALSLMIISSLS